MAKYVHNNSSHNMISRSPSGSSSSSQSRGHTGTRHAGRTVLPNKPIVAPTKQTSRPNEHRDPSGWSESLHRNVSLSPNENVHQARHTRHPSNNHLSSASKGTSSQHISGRAGPTGHISSSTSNRQTHSDMSYATNSGTAKRGKSPQHISGCAGPTSHTLSSTSHMQTHSDIPYPTNSGTAKPGKSPQHISGRAGPTSHSPSSASHMQTHSNMSNSGTAKPGKSPRYGTPPMSPSHRSNRPSSPSMIRKTSSRSMAHQAHETSHASSLSSPIQKQLSPPAYTTTSEYQLSSTLKRTGSLRGSNASRSTSSSPNRSVLPPTNDITTNSESNYQSHLNRSGSQRASDNSSSVRMISSSKFGGSLDSVSSTPRQRRLEDKRTSEKRQYESLELPSMNNKALLGTSSHYDSVSQSSRNYKQAGERPTSISNMNSSHLDQRLWDGSIAATSDRKSDYLNQVASSVRHPEPASKKILADIHSVSGNSSTVVTAEERGHPVAVDPILKASMDSKAVRKLSPKAKVQKFFHMLRRKKKGRHHNSSRIDISSFERATQLNLDKVEAAYLNGGIVGISNLGNTCYMNSIIQCLSHTLELTDIFLSKEFSAGTVCSEFKKAMQNLWMNEASSSSSHSTSKHFHYLNKEIISLRSFKDIFSRHHRQFYGYSQHDAQEFLTHVIGAIHSEMKPPKQKKIDESHHSEKMSDMELGNNRWEWYHSIDGSPIADIFVGQFKSTLTCKKCGHKSTTFDPFWDCGLPLHRSRAGHTVQLINCFGLFCQEEVMDGDNKPICDACRKPQPTVKRMTISRFPPILVIYLKRFNHVLFKKLDVTVTIPQHVELNAFASPERLNSVDSEDTGYDLFAVSNHIGSMVGGHYTADVKHFASQKWFHCNDHRVSACEESKFSRAEFSSREAYILFYRRSIV